MKKIVVAILLAVTSFGFANKVNAYDVNYCMYDGVNDDGSSFRVTVSYYQSQKTFGGDEAHVWAWINPLNDVDIFGQKKNHNDLWTETGGIKIKDSTHANNNKKVSKADVQGNCFQYLYWKVNTGSDDWYVGNNSSEIINGNVARLELVGPYSKTSANAILEELTCTYMKPVDAPHGDMPSIVSYRIIPENNGFRYQIRVGTNLDVVYDGETKSGIIGNAWQGGIVLTNDTYVDLLNPRVFQYSSTGTWTCPSMLEVGLNRDYGGFFVQTSDEEHIFGFPTDELDSELEPDVLSALRELHSGLDSAQYRASYSLMKGSSYIDYEVAQDKTGQVCAYGLEDKMKDSLDNWYYTLQEVNSNLNGNYYQIITNDTYASLNLPIPSKSNIKVSFNKTMTSCDGLPEIYTDCLKNSTNCTISDSKSTFSGKSYDTLVQNVLVNSVDAETMEIAMGKSTGFKFKRLNCELSKRLYSLAGSSLRNNNLQKLKFFDYDGSNEEEHSIYDLSSGNTCSNWGVATNYSCTDEYCRNNLSYDTERKIKEIASYCNDIYDGITKIRLKNESYRARINECIQFDSFYSSLVSEGIISDLTGGCNIASNDAKEIINDVLNIIKIAGPLIAIGLGMLDFAKAVVSGDADKEFKSAGQRFLKRIIAAIVLILLPVILSFIMNIFLKNQPGYNKNSPFCGFGTNSNNAQQSVSTGNVVKPGQNNQNPNGYVPVPR